MATAPTPTTARASLERAEVAYRAAVARFDTAETVENRAAVRTAREERELAQERLALAEQRARDAQAAAHAEAHLAKATRLADLNEHLTAANVAKTLAPELDRLRAAAAELACLGPLLRAKVNALQPLATEGAALAKELGLDSSAAPVFDGRSTLDGLCRAAVHEKLPRAVAEVLDAIDLFPVANVPRAVA
jgi:hypothetical protein